MNIKERDSSIKIPRYLYLETHSIFISWEVRVDRRFDLDFESFICV